METMQAELQRLRARVEELQHQLQSQQQRDGTLPGMSADPAAEPSM